MDCFGYRSELMSTSGCLTRVRKKECREIKMEVKEDVCWISGCNKNKGITKKNRAYGNGDTQTVQGGKIN